MTRLSVALFLVLAPVGVLAQQGTRNGVVRLDPALDAIVSPQGRHPGTIVTPECRHQAHGKGDTMKMFASEETSRSSRCICR